LAPFSRLICNNSGEIQGSERDYILPEDIIEIVKPIADQAKHSSLMKKSYSNLLKHIEVQLTGYQSSQNGDKQMAEKIKQLTKDRIGFIPKRHCKNY
jgi:hypothetical protein